MKLRNYVLVTILIFTLVLAGCSSNKEKDSDQSSATETQTDNKEDEMSNESSPSTGDDTTEDSDSNETKSNKKDSTETELEEEVIEEEIIEEGENPDEEDPNKEDEGGDIDVSLLDRALLESVEFNMPDSFMTVSEGFINGVPETMITYQKDFNNRTETTSEGITTISIYNHDENTAYDFTLGETTGYKYVNDEEDDADIENEINYDGMSLMAWIEEEMEFDAATTIKASQEKINGRKTILLSVAAPEATDEMIPDFQIWFDKEYTFPMKYIMNFGEEWTYTMEVTDFDFNPKLDDDLFIAPDDITFN